VTCSSARTGNTPPIQAIATSSIVTTEAGTISRSPGQTQGRRSAVGGSPDGTSAVVTAEPAPGAALVMVVPA
jgi:hypothetical protein